MVKRVHYHTIGEESLIIVDSGSGKLEFEEFAAMVYTVVNTVDKETMERELREAFKLFDKEVKL